MRIRLKYRNPKRKIPKNIVVASRRRSHLVDVDADVVDDDMLPHLVSYTLGKRTTERKGSTLFQRNARDTFTFWTTMDT
jgi:hypothetical protein